MMLEWALTNVAMTASPLEADQHIQTHELDIIQSMMMMIMTSTNDLLVQLLPLLLLRIGDENDDDLDW